MLEENKNLKSHIKDTPRNLFIKDNKLDVSNHNSNFYLGSYTKTNKLISALYMVTDIMDKEEPIRHKLRSLGTNIITDIYSFDKGQILLNQVNNRVSEILSFIEIAFSVGIVSEMNSSILMKEFLELRKSITEANSKNEDNWLEGFMDNSPSESYHNPKFEGDGEFKYIHSVSQVSNPLKRELNPIGQGTRIGVQRGGTLMKALSDRIPDLRTNKISIERNFSGSGKEMKHQNYTNEILKNKRRDDIIFVIKKLLKDKINFDGATISDIKSIGQGVLVSCSEKTLQRELVSMVSDSVLKKTGSKRWSKYSLK